MAARPDNSSGYVVHVRKPALPLLPHFGLESNIYYIHYMPLIHTPASFLRHICGPRASRPPRATAQQFLLPTSAGF